MRRWPQPFLFTTLPIFALLLAAGAGRAQNDANRKQVKFTTADGVEIVGTFFPGAKKEGCVLLLHPIGKGENSHKPGWDDLATALQKKGFAVLSFDFRGHGDSTTVEPEKFWSAAFPQNRLYAPPAKVNPEQISVEQFKPAYYPILINDIAAAKSYLDRKNDAGEVNTSALVVIGAETGATLGAIWLNSEWYRYKFFKAELGVNPFPRLAEEPEGKGVIAAIFLSISPKLGPRPISLRSVLALPGRDKGVPMVFMYGDGDKKGMAEANKLEEFIKVKGKKGEFTGAVPVKGANDATGRELLRASLGTDSLIVGYLDKVLETKIPEHVNREFQKSEYAWGIAGPQGRIGRLIGQAKAAGDMTLRWNTYEAFIPR
jgi:hypothetical protein